MINVRLHIASVLLMLIVTTPVFGNGFQEIDTSMSDTVTVKVIGSHADSRFEPKVVQVKPGDTVLFEVEEGVHTVTAYHPDNRRNLGIPEGAPSFDSGVLSAGDIWYLEITHEGEYNYFCMPHERLGHVGKIKSNQPDLINTTTNL